MMSMATTGTGTTNDDITSYKMNTKKISVLLLDDEFEIFKRLTKVFEGQETYSVIGQASSCRIGSVMIQTYQPEIVIFNANMTSVTPEEAPTTIRKMLMQSPKTKVVAIIQDSNANLIFRVIKAGAAGCLAVENLSGQELIPSLEQVLAGDIVLPPKVATSFVGVLREHYGPKPEDQPAEVIIKSLTTREKQLLLLMMKGHSYERIAEICDITVSTVKTHFNAIFCKMGVKNRVQAIGIALRQDIQLLVEPDLILELKKDAPSNSK